MKERRQYERFMFALPVRIKTMMTGRKNSRAGGGEDSIVTSSGMSAIASTALSLAKPGNNFISCATIYGGTFALFTQRFKDLKIKARLMPPF